MSTNYEEQELSTEQKDILKKFILYFLPKRGNKRKNEGNEIDTIQTALNRIFNPQFGFRMTRTDILDAFEELGYDVFLMKGEWNSDRKETLPSKKGTSVRLDEGYKIYNAAFIYVDIDASVVRLLRSVTAGTPPNSGIKKLEEKEEMKKRIDLFKQTVKR
ncbi:MAG: hypothetical protein EOO46_20725 [Flavobacterium sp.]|nr:MAG: hypothetical protein EOO46_20725 [Flavobacterium sp.]